MLAKTLSRFQKSPTETKAEGEAKTESLGPSAQGANGELVGFDRFWQTWKGTGRPRHKKEAKEVWKKRKLEEFTDGIVQRLELLIEHKRECDRTKTFWPEFQDPHRWLKNSGWNDEVPNA